MRLLLPTMLLQAVPARFVGTNRRQRMKKIAVLLLALASVMAFAHSGGTDKNGCHYDRKNGGYHCH